MTGTAATESTEFESIYKLKVTIVPTNKPMIRKVGLKSFIDLCTKLRKKKRERNKERKNREKEIFQMPKCFFP